MVGSDVYLRFVQRLVMDSYTVLNLRRFKLWFLEENQATAYVQAVYSAPNHT